MTAKLFTLPKQVPFTNAGALIPGAKAYFFEAGTSTPLATYTDYTLVTPHTDPVVADGEGHFPAIYYDETLNYKITITDANDVERYTQDYAADGPASANVPEAAEVAAGLTIVDYDYDPGNVLRYGTNTSPGVTDMSAAFQAAADVIGTYDFVAPAGSYLIGTQVSVVFPSYRSARMIGYGAVILSDALADYPFRVTSGTFIGRCRIEGFYFDQWNTTVGLGAIELVGTNYNTLDNISVEVPYDAPATYGAIKLRSSTPTDTSTACFWTNITNISMRARTAQDHKANAGIILQGACNATTVSFSNFSNLDKCIHHTTESGQTASANALVVTHCAFEGYESAYTADPEISNPISGARFAFNRFESGGSYAYVLNTATAQPAVPMTLLGNYYISNAWSVSKASNANNLYITELEFSVTPSSDAVIANQNDYIWRALAGDFIVRTPTNSGFDLQSAGGTSLASLKIRSGGGASLASPTGIYQSVVKGISATATESVNIRSKITLASGTATVTFGTAEPDANYFISLAGNASETFSWASKTTAGFTINSSNGASTATVDWILIR